jgi:SAM-dependent methyltransferase
MYGVLSWEGRAGGNWDEASFFAVGRADLEALWNQAASASIGFPAGGHALDFGCGLGRLTRGLADRFDRVVGVDASPTMIARARELNRDVDGVEFRVNERPDLQAFPSVSFDVIVSLITLQHIPPEAARSYVTEFVRLIRPGGLIAFQLPASRSERPRPLRQRVANRAREIVRRLPRAYDMHAHPESDVRRLLDDAGGRTLGVIDDQRAGDWGRSLLYFVTRDAAN